MQQAALGAAQQHPSTRHSGGTGAACWHREAGRKEGSRRAGLHQWPHKPGAVRATRSFHSPAVFPPLENRCGRGGKRLQTQGAFQGGACVCTGLSWHPLRSLKSCFNEFQSPPCKHSRPPALAPTCLTAG